MVSFPVIVHLEKEIASCHMTIACIGRTKESVVNRSVEMSGLMSIYPFLEIIHN